MESLSTGKSRVVLLAYCTHHSPEGAPKLQLRGGHYLPDALARLKLDMLREHLPDLRGWLFIQPLRRGEDEHAFPREQCRKCDLLLDPTIEPFR